MVMTMMDKMNMMGMTKVKMKTQMRTTMLVMLMTIKMRITISLYLLIYLSINGHVVDDGKVDDRCIFTDVDDR